MTDELEKLKKENEELKKRIEELSNRGERIFPEVHPGLQTGKQ